jgi:gluconate 2-dehydrogenase gamma chain
MPRLTRRRLVASSALAVSVGAVAADAVADTLQLREPWSPVAADRPDAIDTRPGYLYFSAEEAAFVEAAVSRLIPADELGPGALEAGVARFLDRQLAGPYGQGDHFYLNGPNPKGEPTQGWQMGAPAQVYRTAIAAVNRYLRDQRGKAFSELAAVDQDAVLADLEKGAVDLKGGVAAKAFFGLLLQNTLEGFFGDPIYGGNRDMAGWKLIGFPGARYDYRDFVARHGEAFPLPPVSIMGRPDWKRT